MGYFEKVRFKGEFRDYQERVLNNADSYSEDGKINIVAAPGSGKTVLGLELICRIGNPCLIFSPTSAIREQWGERFKDLFLSDKDDFDKLFSTDLHNIKLVNSVTYQALFSAMEKIKSSEDGEEDFSDVDILREIKEKHIGTLCLDEAHHLKNEWQKALEKLISLVGDEVKIISLTATPPYDSEGNEWGRYLAMCGEVDEEIFVPELVARDTLCPHQDYIFFNYPTADEAAALNNYRVGAYNALSEIKEIGFMAELCEKISGDNDYDRLFSSVKEYISLLVLFKYYGFNIDKRIIRVLTGKTGLPAFSMYYAETAFEFLLSGDLLDDLKKEELIGVLRKYSVYNKRRVELVLDERLKRTLISSVGKLQSIVKIADSEYGSLGENLRMLILTDYIKKEEIKEIASADSFASISVVSIFESLRRNVGEMKIGVLSGSLVILPDSIGLEDVKHTQQKIEGTEYSIIGISGSVNSAVKKVGELFERGEIQALIGTKALLGEGWDSPCINSLIIASFVGSYVLSNQMRGRAIRIDKSNPDKTANIWHLVTAEPSHVFAEGYAPKVMEYISQDNSELVSYDYEILKRRFDSFMGPDYEKNTIESGIERISVIKPPFSKKGIEKINEDMLFLSRNRAAMREKWRGEVKDCSFSVAVESKVDKEKRVPAFTFVNASLIILLLTVEYIFIRVFEEAVVSLAVPLGFGVLLFTAVSYAVLYFGFRAFKRLVLHFNPARSIKTLGIAVYKTLTECGFVSPSAKVDVGSDGNLSYVTVLLRNASVHDQNIFNTAIGELLSPIDNPRYILIKRNRKNKYNYKYSFACPSVIGRKKEYAEILSRNLKKTTDNFEAVYTRNENGRAIILKCRRRSYITHNQKSIDKGYKVTRYE